VDTAPGVAGSRPAFRADQVGSLLRPPGLLRARDEHAAGRLDLAGLRGMEDRSILDALRMQREAGLDVLTDGELRRGGWMGGFLDAVDGFVPGGFALPMHAAGGEAPTPSAPVAVAARVRARRGPTEEERAFLRAHAQGPYKITVPSPTTFAYLCFQRGLTDRVYGAPRDLLGDLVAIVRNELHAAATDGAAYVQLDAPRYMLHVDPALHGPLQDWGVDLNRALAESIEADNACVADLPRHRVAVGIHLCRGNAAGGGWFAGGGYDAIAERVFGSLDVDRFLLEYDSDRAGDFAPLRFVPAPKTVVLGLVTTKSPALESPDALCRRIEQASAHVPLERLAISPQCGFASVAAGNPLSADDQRRKLDLVVAVARRVWG